MAKVKNPLPEAENIKDLVYTKQKDQHNGMTHNVRFADKKKKDD